MNEYQTTSLWQTAFAPKNDGLDKKRQMIVDAYEAFRERVALLLEQIRAELPNLTLHDITHVDALWRVASEIAGPDYPINPAEALVLGGAFLLHDAAHCRAAYPGGLDELRATDEWKDASAQRGLDPDELTAGSEDFQTVLFDTLRVLHPRQAKRLAFAEWSDKPGNTLRLFPHDALREAYGDLIGEVAESHWFHPHELEDFGHHTITAPVCLSPAKWTVSPLKIAVLLRVADAAHIDAQRAPRLLLAMNKPSGISKIHWQFQARLHQPHCDRERQELIFSGNPFPADEQSAWWQAFDAANLADRELSAADHLLRDHGLVRLSAREVAGIKNPESFARQVPTRDWHPVNTALRISNIQSVVERFGGKQLYGDTPYLALRELLQNARDAVHAARSLNYLNEDEGEIEVSVDDVPGGHWLHVTDTGIGMSRYVLTEVLLDFGRSLWRSPDLRGEWSGLAASGFEAIGQFGIGFFSVFMLGKQVRVCSRRCDPKEGENNQWLLEFQSGTEQRPLLREPGRNEGLRKHGTRVSVLLSAEKMLDLCTEIEPWYDSPRWSLAQRCAHLAPALDIDLYLRDSTGKRDCLVAANDWKSLPPLQLLQRLDPFGYREKNPADFGHWSHLLDLEDSAGELAGRCAVTQRGRSGFGIVKGIMAGQLDNLAGIIFCKPQSDLARSSASPNITLSELQVWSEMQKGSLIDQGAMTIRHSVSLVSMGASYQDLVLGNFEGMPISYQELINALQKIDRLIVHIDDVTHDGDDDVLERDFLYFNPSTSLLEFSDGFLDTPDWVGELTDSSLTRESWSIDAALQSALEIAWGHPNWAEDDVVVGSVNGTEIFRKCRIATR